MHIILIPGLWLDGSSWEKVVPTLEQAGHTTNALTLPGMESPREDRSAITLRDHLDAVVEAIDNVAPANGKVILVGHSAASGIACAAMDARTDRVARVIYIGGFPIGDGDTIAGGFATENGDLPMPEWTKFGDEDLVDLDDNARADFRARAIPSPAHLTEDRVQLSDERRFDIPVTAICPEYTSATLQGWIRDGEEPVQEFTKLRDVEYVDLPTGHWPQFTRPVDLAHLIIASIGGSPADTPGDEVIDAWDPMTVGENTRVEPPMAGDEVATLLGTLERNRSTLAWKCNGLDSPGMRTKLGASGITLGGLLKHLALVEDDWFSVKLHGNDWQTIWATGDWKTDPNWDWNSAAEHSPEELFTLWKDAVDRSRTLVNEALASGGLDQRASFVWPDGRSPSLRRVLADMIEEYARHCGHADLIRESIDGRVGE